MVKHASDGGDFEMPVLSIYHGLMKAQPDSVTESCETRGRILNHDKRVRIFVIKNEQP
jgi:hypothetical protein